MATLAADPMWSQSDRKPGVPALDGQKERIPGQRHDLNKCTLQADPCGENGEFHTFVWDAPMYREPIPCRTGEVVTRDGFVFCDVLPA